MTRIAVDPGRLIGRLDRRVFGGFVEHLGRCIYGGIFDEGSALADARGFRRDVLGLLRDLRLGVLRWPGGNFASNYHWADGIGPKDARPRRPNLAWGGEESNRFGTHEFLSYCAELGAEPYICLNMGTGTLPEALAWIEYCNGSGQTEWARRRREEGREEPYRVRYWAERAIRCARALIARAAHVQGITRPPRIAYDEWNVWFRTQDGTLEERYTFPDALAVATYLNIFVRNCDWVAMANLAQLVNAIAPVVTTA